MSDFWFYKRRIELGLKKGELGSLIKRSSGIIGTWEAAKKIPTADIDLIHDIAKALNMSVADVLVEIGFNIKFVYTNREGTVFTDGSPQSKILRILEKCDRRKQKTIVKMVELLYEEVSERVLDTMDLEIDDD